MPTNTKELTPKAPYELLVSATAAWFLLSSDMDRHVRVVQTADDVTLPDEALRGHKIGEDGGMTRAHIGDGAVWGKVTGSQPAYLSITTPT
jgi:hypothetical protein